MKSFVALVALVAVVAADVSHIVGKSPEADAEILSQVFDDAIDNFKYGFQTSNGINSQKSGALKQVGNEAAVAVQGSDSYTSPEGVQFITNYVADEFGYRAEGAHLPTAPPAVPIPEYIARAIEYIRTHPAKEEVVKYRN